MKKFLTISLVAGTAFTALAGPGQPGQLTVNIRHQASSTSVVAIHYRSKADSVARRELLQVYPGKSKETVVRPLSGSSQIIFILDEAYLVSKGESLDIDVNLENYSHKLPRYLAPVGQLKQYSAKALLPRLIDSLYARIDTLGSRQELDARMASNHTEIMRAINAANVSADDQSLLYTYESVRGLMIRQNYLSTHKAEKESAGIGEWFSKGFDISNPNFSKISSNELYMSIINGWWIGRKLKDPDLEEEFKVLDLLRLAKSESLKQEFSKNWVHWEIRSRQFSPALKAMYGTIMSTLQPCAQRNFIDSVYKRYAKMDKGMPASEIVARNEDGKTVRLSDYRGKMVVIDLWATWCSGCIANLPKFHEIAKQYEGKDDIVFLTISYELDGYEKLWKEIATEKKVNGPNSLILYRREDSKDFQKFMEGYSITGVPRYIAIDKKGNFLNNSMGAYVDKDMERMIEDYYNDQQ